MAAAKRRLLATGALLLGIINGVAGQEGEEVPAFNLRHQPQDEHRSLFDPRTVVAKEHEQQQPSRSLSLFSAQDSHYLQEEPSASSRRLSPEVLRGLVEITTEFPQCRKKTPAECQAIIEAEYKKNPKRFGGPGQTFEYEIRHMRLRVDDNYYWVIIVPDDETGSLAAGPYGDGMQYYFSFWSVGLERYPLGPWDCREENGALMTTESCCAMILRSEVRKDDRGNYIECHVQPMHRADPAANKIVMAVNPHTNQVNLEGAQVY